MNVLVFILIANVEILNFGTYVNADSCSKSYNMKIEGNCYNFQSDIMRYGDVLSSCANKDPPGVMASCYKDKHVMEKLEGRVKKFVEDKMENGYWWLGIVLDDDDPLKAAKDREWKYYYDDERFIQKDFPLWDVDGGPKEKGLTCTAVNASLGFRVKAVDCGGPRIPVICMGKKDERCFHDFAPYLIYGQYCLAALNGPLDYSKIAGACHPNTPTPFKDEEMREMIQLAARNSFLGGGIYQNVRRVEGKFIDLNDKTEVDQDVWEEGEPRGDYDCTVLSIQKDFSLKLKTYHCDFLGASFCAVARMYFG